MNKLLIFPTDTVYGIGCSIYDRASQMKIYKIKNRPLDKPLAVLCSSIEQIEEIAYLNDEARKLINAFLPGPFTLILKAKENICDIVGFDTVGVRIPNSTLALKILNEIGPMTTTSVNDSGSVALNDYETIYSKYKDLVDEIYKPCGESSNLASTVVKIENDNIKILREGAIKLADIKEILNK